MRTILPIVLLLFINSVINRADHAYLNQVSDKRGNLKSAGWPHGLWESALVTAIDY